MSFRRFALVLSLAASLAAARDGVVALPDPPHLGGICLTCPQFDFGPFAPTTTWQTHCSTTSTGTDCNVYAFDVMPGRNYEFSTCVPGPTTFAGMITVRRPDTCAAVTTYYDTCGDGAHVFLTAPSGVTSLLAEVGAAPASGAFGDYCLAWRACHACEDPMPGTYVPRTTCGTIDGVIDECNDDWYTFLVTAGSDYLFSTCEPVSGCLGATIPNTVLLLYDPAASCTTPLAMNDNALSCMTTGGSTLRWSAPFTGSIRLHVRGLMASERGPFTLAYAEVPCSPPSVISITPSTGTLPPDNCTTRTETFTVVAGGSATYITWSIAAPSGSAASPPSGTAPVVGGVATFQSTLRRPACPGPSLFDVQVTARGCGTAFDAITYRLSETTPPRLSGCPASRLIDCTTFVPPAPTLTATDNCDPSPQVVFTETLVPGSCPGNSAILRSWVATDCSGNQRRCLQNIVRRDRTPPSLTGNDAWCLHPIDHAYYCVTTAELSPTMADDCSPPLRMTFVSCTSSEPDSGTGPDDLPDDCLVSPDGTQACVRVERAGDVVDRTYVLGGVAVDACGNRSAPRPVAVVTVPHDDLPHPECRASDSGFDVHF